MYTSHTCALCMSVYTYMHVHTPKYSRSTDAICLQKRSVRFAEGLLGSFIKPLQLLLPAPQRGG